jgi:hypothetical protein
LFISGNRPSDYSFVFIVATYTWENNNIVKQVDIIPREKDTTIKLFKYDNKPNAFKSISLMLHHQFYDEVYLSANNVTESSYDDGSASSISTYVYTYNSKNYPTKRIETEKRSIDGSTTERTEQFEYVE